MAASQNSIERANEERALGIEHTFASQASVELAPKQVESAAALSDHLPLGTRIYVPFTPGAKRQDTLGACRRLQAEGMQPVPHLPARSVAGPGELDEWLGAFSEMGVAGVMLVAGDRERPVGPYRDTLDLLDSGKLAEHGVGPVGVTAYPEGHPLVVPDVLEAALARKIEYAAATGLRMWIVTQFVFDPAPAIALLERLRTRACPLPVHVGLPGPARLRTLLAFAVKCGVGASAKMLTRQPSVVRLLNNWTPDTVLGALARYRAASPRAAPAGIHLFTFGGLVKTAQWLRTQREGQAIPAPANSAEVVDFHVAAGEEEIRRPGTTAS